MKNLGYYNGKYDEIEKMQIPMLDRVCWFGDGVYDATYAHNHVVFDMDAHLTRFYNSARLLGMNIPMERDELEKLLRELVLKVDDGDQFVYMQVTRGNGLRGHIYSDDMQGNLWITLTPSPVADTYKPIDVITYEDKRFLYCNCKTLNLIPSCLAATAADKAGCQEAIFHRGDIVTECAHSNVSIFKDGKVITHPLDDKILPGTARLRLLDFAERLGYGTEEREYTLDELQSIFGDVKTNQYGVIKPQLAKQADKVTNPKIFEKKWLISKKLDGVKALFYYKDGVIHTASRGGK